MRPINKARNRESSNSPKGGWKGKKFFMAAAIASILAGGAYEADINNSKRIKSHDFDKYGTTIVKNDTTEDGEVIPHIYMMSPDSTLSLLDLDELIENNRDVLGSDLKPSLLSSIMLSEEDLKTKNGGIIKRWDEKLERYGVERSRHSRSLTGKMLGYFQTGSYGPFQVQREVIDKYKSNPEIWNKICNNIANFKFKTEDGEWKELYIRLGYKNAEDMAKDIKDHKIDMYKCGGKVETAIGAICISQLHNEIKNNVMNFNSESGYEQIRSQVKLAEENEYHKKARKIADNNRKFRNNLVTIYVLSDDDKNVGFNDIGNIYNSDAFQNGIAGARWCCNYMEANKNCDYLTMLQLMKLNQYFESNGENDIEIVKATGRFGPTSTKLVNEIFQKNFNQEEAQKFLDNMDEGERNTLYQDAVNNYIQHLKLLFTLGSDKNHPNTRTKINEKQKKFLKWNASLTFIHKYNSVQSFFKYIEENKSRSLSSDKKNRIIGEVSSKWNDYVKNHNSEACMEILDMLTDYNKFMEETGLTDKDYMDFFKGYFGPTLESTTVDVSHTKISVPEIQSNLNGTSTSNERNSLIRFTKAVDHENQLEAKSNDIYNIVETDSGELIVQPESKIGAKEGLSDIYVALGNLGNLVESNGKQEEILCRNNNDGTYEITKKGEYLQSILYKYAIKDGKKNKELRNAILMIIGKDKLSSPRDISAPVIKAIIRSPSGNELKHINRIGQGEGFTIWVPEVR